MAAGAGLSIGAALGAGASAQAANFTVTNLSDGPDPGPAGSLRKAITDANANAGADTVLFNGALSGSILLSQASIPITEAVNVTGPGPNVLGVDAYYGLGRIFTIDPTVSGDPVTISGLSMAYGHPAGSGGAIFNQDAKLTVSNSTLFANATGSAAVEIAGGAIADAATYASGTQTKIESSTITGNSARDGFGGGVASAEQLGTIANSTISANYAYGDGGGTFSSDDGGTFQNTTVAHNYAYDDGGGVATGTGGPNISFHNTIVGDNSTDGTRPDLLGTDPFDAEFSLFQSTSGVTINPTVANSNVLGVNPQLSSYTENHGGSTPTLLPGPTSPVIDQGKTAAAATTDQRGSARPFDVPAVLNSAAAGADAADIGAVETTLNEATPVDMALTMSDSPDPVFVGDPLAFSLNVTNNGPNTGTGVSVFALLPQGLTFSAAGSSPGCTPSPFYAGSTLVGCAIGAMLSGTSQTRNVGATADSSLVGAPYVSSYGSAVADQGDPNPGNNDAFTDAHVIARPATPPPQVQPQNPGNAVLAAAIKKCKKKFRGKKRAKCIKKAKKRAARTAFARVNGDAAPRHPFDKRQRPPALRRMPRSEYPDLP
jgi:uncharacterized repeat protein (TIGR01451 family)